MKGCRQLHLSASGLGGQHRKQGGASLPALSYHPELPLDKDAVDYGAWGGVLVRFCSLYKVLITLISKSSKT